MGKRRIRRVVNAVRDERWGRGFVFFVLVAFLLQGFLTQSHMHFGAPAQKSVTAASLSLPGTKLALSGTELGAAEKSSSKSLPGQGQEINCPICHAASIAGAAFASSAPVLRVPSLGSLVVYVDAPGIFVERAAAPWRSRAPPSV